MSEKRDDQAGPSDADAKQAKETLPPLFSGEISKTEANEIWDSALRMMEMASANGRSLSPDEALSAAHQAMIGLHTALKRGVKLQLREGQFEGQDYVQLTLRGKRDGMRVEGQEEDPRTYGLRVLKDIKL